jgi:ATP-dependent Lon protease
MMPPFQHPALVALLIDRWDSAFEFLHHQTEELLGNDRAQRLLDVCGDRLWAQNEIHAVVDELYAHGKIASGEYALAWSLLTCDPARPATFHRVLPQVQFALDNPGLSTDDGANVRDRLRVWWRAAEGEFTGSRQSMFAIARAVLDDDYQPAVEKPAAIGTQNLLGDLGLPWLTVLKGPFRPNSYQKVYKEIVDEPLKLVFAARLDAKRDVLHREYPHARAAIDMILRGLVDGKPVTFRPVLLVGAAGSGKSRLARRIADLMDLYISRYDAASSADNMFSGSAKTWANTEPSVPLRAVEQSRTANPMVLLDEIDKASRSHHGGLWHCLHGYLDVETSRRMRDQSLDAEVDLSACSYIATANDASVLPSTLRDRFRIIRIPAPTLAHLPALAACVVDELAKEDESLMGHVVQPFAPDELKVMGAAWSHAKFSMRALQKIVQATLEARDAHAMRH